jgi:DNA modification methylase
MTHLSENSHPLAVKHVSVQSHEDLCRGTQDFTDVCILRLPPCDELGDYRNPLQDVGLLVADVADRLGPEATLITVGEVVDLVQVQASMPPSVRYQHWIAIKRTFPGVVGALSLPQYHFGALIHTRYKPSLRHTKTRIRYTYCPVCDKTTKDYGGKKHTYHEYGTLISDVWRDIDCELGGDLTPIITRFADLFGIKPYEELLVLDCRPMNLKRLQMDYGLDLERNYHSADNTYWAAKLGVSRERSPEYRAELRGAQTNFLPHLVYNPSVSAATIESTENNLAKDWIDKVLQGDCLEKLREIPDNSIDFIFTDPPYNLGKQYSGYMDDLEIREYFDWCDQWIAELARILKPGHTCAILNIPLWAIRHFLFMKTLLNFQNWIVWDALAFPVRLIMPAHYTVLCFSKGEPRELPGLIGEAGPTEVPNALKTFKALESLAENYCLRSQCVTKRQAARINDRGLLTDLWWDIHRLKHNSRRVDHPTQLPPHLMYRLISIFTRPGEVVLDCFNGAGTTTLAAHQLGRRYIGIEISEKYCDMARERHKEILEGLDPFRKEERVLTAKNSPVPRLPKQGYKIPKKTLQLEVKRVANELERLPTREELVRYGKYPIEYYDKYFVSWGEVCAAARTTGMTEDRVPVEDKPSIAVVQLSLGLKKAE